MISRLSISFILVILPFFFYLLTLFLTRNKILSRECLRESDYALVLGAGLKKDGSPTRLLEERVLTSIEAIKTEKIKKVIFSGSINHKGNSEPIAMQNIAESQGVSSDQIEVDENGKSTFDSCINFLLSNYPQPVILVTQLFHLPRSLLICHLLKIDAYGLPANSLNYSIPEQFWWFTRESIAVPYNLYKYTRFCLGQFFEKEDNHHNE